MTWGRVRPLPVPYIATCETWHPAGSSHAMTERWKRDRSWIVDDRDGADLVWYMASCGREVITLR